jgi:hypothetical protein
VKHPFQVGETYRNEKGDYEVVSIDGQTMVIRWTDGSTWEGSVALQARILARRELEEQTRETRALQRKRRAASRADTRGRDFSGLVGGDFQDGVGGTTWRRREGLGGLLAQRLSDVAAREFQSYTVYRRPEVHVASPSHYTQKEKWRQPKFDLALDEAKATYGFCIEKSDEPMDDTWHWAKFLAALEGGPELCQRIEAAMSQHSLDWRVWLRMESELVACVGLSGTMLVWTPLPDGEPVEMTWQGFFERLRGIPENRWCDLYLAADLPKAEAISAGAGVADRIVAVYRALAPLYEASL